MNTMHILDRRNRAIVLIAAAGLLPVAGVAAATTATTEPPTGTEPAATQPTESGVAVDPSSLDVNGDGEVLIGLATPGPRDDGAYYQAFVDGVLELAAEYGFADPIIVDNVDPAQAETELRNLARQNVDVMAIGAGELSDPLGTLVEEFPDLFWYCNCGAGLDVPGIGQSTDDSSQISYTAGFATGLLLQDTESTSVAFLGCCDLDFEREAFLAFEAGLQAVDDSFTVVYLPTGDFNDVAGATEAYNQAVADGVGAVYPFLGGSHTAIVGLANEDGVITMSAGLSDACESEDLDYQIAVQFDAGDYIHAWFEAYLAGEVEAGGTMHYEVGVFDKTGAKFCDATPEQEEALQAVRDQIAAGEFDELFGTIKGEAYGGGAPVTTG